MLIQHDSKHLLTTSLCLWPLNPIFTLKWQQLNGHKFFSVFWVGCPPHAFELCSIFPMLYVGLWGDLKATPELVEVPGEVDHPRPWPIFFCHAVLLQYWHIMPSEQGYSFTKCGSLQILIWEPWTLTWFVETLSPQEVGGVSSAHPTPWHHYKTPMAIF